MNVRRDEGKFAVYSFGSYPSTSCQIKVNMLMNEAEYTESTNLSTDLDIAMRRT